MRLWYVLPAAALILESAIGTSHATVTLFETFKTQFFAQSSDLGAPVPTGYSFVPRLTVSDPSDVANVSVVAPKNTLNLTSNDGLTYDGDQGLFLSKAAMDFAYPNSTYTFQIAGGTLGSQSGAIDISADQYANNVPQYTGGTYSLFQNLDVFQPNLISWNGFQTTSGANTPLTFLTIFDQSGAVAFTTQGTNLLTDALVPADTLLPSSNYTVDLVFSNRQIDATNNFGGSSTSVAFDLRTEFSFTTNVPEPSTLTMAVLSGLALSMFFGRQRWR
ncbi:MAG TPA: hypothetical protein VGG64_13850 [Pirellulales bacterium]|jgi:hypothetical protein